jgi:succinate-acetate transporter protein
MSAAAPAAPTRIVLRPIANPLPLGFLALAAATLLLSALQLGWLEKAEGRSVALILIAFVVPLQFVASLLGFLARDVAAGTGMGVLSGTWLSVALVMLTTPAGATSDALGLLLLMAATAMLIPAVIASWGKLVATAVLGTTSVRFAVTGLYQMTDGSAWKTTAGIVGLVLCAVAVYAALAMALEDGQHRTVLPVLRRGRGERAMEGGLRDQLDTLEHEAGVRAQL